MADEKTYESADNGAEVKAVTIKRAGVSCAPGTLARKALSVVMSFMLVITLNPFTGSSAAIATGAETTSGGGRLRASLIPL